MSLFQLKSKQKLPITLEDAWDFFSSPANLKIITPDYMAFKVKTGGNRKMYPGQIISYTVKPAFNIPLTWITEILHVEEKKYFVDNQIQGPYKLWHHKHFFEEIENGIEMRDEVDYILPFGLIGDIVHSLYVKKRLEGIFEYRKTKLIELFGKINEE